MARISISAVSTGGKITADTTNALIANDADHEARITALSTTTNKPQPGPNALTGYYYADAYPGIDESGAGDSTAGINALHAAVPAGATIFYRPGTYKITATIIQPKPQVTVMGVGDASVWSFQPRSADTMMTITGTSYLRFVAMKFAFVASTAAAVSTLFVLNDTFCCKFHRCTFQGMHNSAGDIFGTTSGHIGVILTANAGDSLFYDCMWLNLGVGIATDSIQNGVIGGKFGTCYVGIHGTTNINGSGQNNPGMSLSGYVVFVSSGSSPGLVRRNVLVDGQAGQWWFNQVWCEGADVAIEVGSSSGGPSQFVMTDCKIAARTNCIVIHRANWPKFSGVQVGQGTVGFTIDAAVTHGVAEAITSNIAGDPQLSGGVYKTSVFRPGWVLNGNVL